MLVVGSAGWAALPPVSGGGGVGALTLLDFDSVSLSNLQRQTLHSDATIGFAEGGLRPRLAGAKSTLTCAHPA
ncbi:Molybdopterin-synthase adenylyltransferase [Raoultella terrigena]|uniref:Molybdopterin-synthase adenylyltransferase n=1 Tax=Raoultella terrigena TaxID=577 RepID=A0A4U9DAT7_RAOTE|nr:Molybdopterin-synthase adenylyltransferase [Raoultella terrigena]